MTPIHTPDHVLLRRFGYVRAVGGAAYILAVVVLAGSYGTRVWPLGIGVPVLAVVTTAYFRRASRYPRLAVTASLVADAVVLAGAVAFFGGTGSGLVLLQAIVVVSAGILLGPATAIAFTALGVLLGLGQLGLEQAGITPALLYRPPLDERLPILLASLAGLASVGYLTATYASRLHDLIALAGAEAEAVRARGRRRQEFVRRAAEDALAPLRELRRAADALEADLPGERRDVAARVRAGLERLESEVGVLAELGVLDAVREARPEPVPLAAVVQECVATLGERLDGEVTLDLAPIRVVAGRQAVRRVVLNLLENVAEHTPPGTSVRLQVDSRGAQGVLIVSDDGPGVPPARVPTLFDPPEHGRATVGLPLVRELCEAMGAQVRYEPAPGGARFVVVFRLAPRAAPERAPATVPQPGPTPSLDSP